MNIKWLSCSILLSLLVSFPASAAYDDRSGNYYMDESCASEAIAYEDGQKDGYNTGYDDGNKDGYDSGYYDGYESGQSDGYSEENPRAMTRAMTKVTKKVPATQKNALIPPMG